jgi:hypothetical protein
MHRSHAYLIPSMTTIVSKISRRRVETKSLVVVVVVVVVVVAEVLVECCDGCLVVHLSQTM